MAIRNFIYKIIPTNLKKQSVFLRLANTQPELTYREFELVLSRDVDGVQYVKNLKDNDLRALWEAATPIDANVYEESKVQVGYVPFYEQLVANAFTGLQKVDLDTAYNQVLTLMNDHEDIKAQFIAINKNLRLNADERSPSASKREQLLWLLVLSLVNLIDKDDN